MSKFAVRNILSRHAEIRLRQRGIGAVTAGTIDDAKLIALGRTFDALATKIDQAIDHGLNIAMDVLEQFGRVEAEIVVSPATTVEGLRVKARAACWALLGDLDPTDEATTDRKMAVSIVRDLIRLHDSGLERPGALKELLADLI